MVVGRMVLIFTFSTGGRGARARWLGLSQPGFEPRPRHFLRWFLLFVSISQRTEQDGA